MEPPFGDADSKKIDEYEKISSFWKKNKPISYIVYIVGIVTASSTLVPVLAFFISDNFARDVVYLYNLNIDYIFRYHPQYPETDTPYYVKSAVSQMYMTAHPINSTGPSFVIQAPKYGGQTWTFTAVDVKKSKYTIKSDMEKVNLGSEGPHSNAKTLHVATPEIWVLEPVLNGNRNAFFIKSASSDQYITVFDQSRRQEALTIFSNNPIQFWILEKAERGK